ncbi:unnamed protein product, partial [Clonostachys byssicola]
PYRIVRSGSHGEPYPQRPHCLSKPYLYMIPIQARHSMPTEQRYSLKLGHHAWSRVVAPSTGGTCCPRWEVARRKTIKWPKTALGVAPPTGKGVLWEDFDPKSPFLKKTIVNITWLQVPTNSSRIVERAFIKVSLNHWHPRGLRRIVDRNGEWPAGFTLPLIRMRGKEAHGTSNILVLPDGPGVPGTKMIEERGDEMFPFVGEKYNLVSFDARGVGGSDPAIRCGRHTGRFFPKKFYTEQYKDIYHDAKLFMGICRLGGKHHLYVNTPQVVEDIHTIMYGLGQVKAHLWGFGYGTIVAQSYAMRFPELVGRMVFDGVSDMDQWYLRKYHETRYQDTDAVFQYMLQDCIDLGSDCALSKFGDNSHSLKTAILTFGKRLSLGNYRFAEDANFTYNHMLIWIYGSLGSRAKFLEMARHLARYMERDIGDSPLAIDAPDTGFRRESDAAFFFMCNDGRRRGKQFSKDDYPKSQEKLNEEMAPFLNSSLFGIHSLPIYHLKRFCTAQLDLRGFPYNYDIKPIVHTAVPPLLMTNTMDPFTPISSTKSAKIRWPNSKVVQLTTYGHLTIDMASTCTKRYLRNYWMRGILPENDVLCNAGQRPPPKWKKKKKGGKKKGDKKGDRFDTEADPSQSDTEDNSYRSDVEDDPSPSDTEDKASRSDTEGGPSRSDAEAD